MGLNLESLPSSPKKALNIKESSTLYNRRVLFVISPARTTGIVRSGGYQFRSSYCMYIEEKQLREFIKDSGLVSRADLEHFSAEADKRRESVGAALVRKGKVSDDDLRKMQAYLLGIPFVDLKAQRIEFETLSLIPEPIARTHNIISFKKTGESLEVAMLDTDDLAAIDFIKKKTHLKILPRLTDSAS